MRLALWAPATAASGRVQVFSTWPITAGAVFWPLLGALAVVSLPLLLVQFVVGMGLGYAGDAMGDALWPGLVAAAVLGVATALEAPLLIGFLAHAYRRLALRAG